MKIPIIALGLCAMITITACGRRKPDPTSTGDTTSTSDAVNRANGAHGLTDSSGRKMAGDTTADGKLTKKDTGRR